jgi:hypothetical protein
VSVEGREQVEGALRALAVELDRGVVIGVLGERGSKQHEGEAGDLATSPPTMVDIATWHEFGIPGRLPERSFLRATIEQRKPDIVKRVSKEAKAVIEGSRSGLDAWERVGLAVVGMVQERIAAGIPPALHPITVERKGSDKPLIDTGQLRSSITHEVR